MRARDDTARAIADAIDESIVRDMVADVAATMVDAVLADGYEDDDGDTAWGVDDTGREWRIRPTLALDVE